MSAKSVAGSRMLDHKLLPALIRCLRESDTIRKLAPTQTMAPTAPMLAKRTDDMPRVPAASDMGRRVPGIQRLKKSPSEPWRLNHRSPFATASAETNLCIHCERRV